MALIGHVDCISRSLIEGWVHDTDRPDMPVSVSVMINSREVATTVASLHRPGLSETPNGPPVDDRMFRFEIEPPLSPFVAYMVHVVESPAGTILPNGARELPAPGARISGDGPLPILVTSAGRSGSTMLLNEFTRHPSIVVGDRYPYEIKQIAYYAAAFRALVADGDRTRSTDPDTMLASERCHMIGANPYNIPAFFDLGTSDDCLRTFWESQLPVRYARTFRSIIQEYYQALAEGQGKKTAHYFCEKGDPHPTAREGARLFFDSLREIVIVRDPRDLLCSAMAFWRLPPESAKETVRDTISHLTRRALDTAPDTLVVRYEDLVREPTEARRRMSDFLELDLGRMGDVPPVPDAHRTSPSALESIGRWKRDLTEAQAEFCEATFGGLMRAFGYETSASWPPARRPRTMENEHRIEVTRGTDAISTLYDRDTGDGTSLGSSTRLDARLGTGEAGTAFLRDGWSAPERAWAWSETREASIRLPSLRGTGHRRLRIVLAPFTDTVKLPTQRVSLSIDGIYFGTTRIAGMAALEVNLPATPAVMEHLTVVTFRFPDAISPAELRGNGDTRMLGCAIHRLSIHEMRDADAA